MTEPAGFDHSELQLSAFRYLSGEMSETESLIFEERLAEDQTAREAVAETMELCAATQLAYADAAQLATVEQQTDSGKNRQTIRVSWMVGMVAAICLSFVLGFFAKPGQQMVERETPPRAKHQEQPAVNANPTSTEDAVGLLQAFNMLPHTVNLDEMIAGIDPETGRPQESVEESSVAEDDSFAVPSWMLAAVDVQPSPQTDPLQTTPEIQDN